MVLRLQMVLSKAKRFSRTVQLSNLKQLYMYKKRIELMAMRTKRHTRLLRFVYRGFVLE